MTQRIAPQSFQQTTPIQSDSNYLWLEDFVAVSAKSCFTVSSGSPSHSEIETLVRLYADKIQKDRSGVPVKIRDQSYVAFQQAVDSFANRHGIDSKSKKFLDELGKRAEQMMRNQPEKIAAAKDPHDPNILAQYISKTLTKMGGKDSHVKIDQIYGSTLSGGPFPGSKLEAPVRGWDGIARMFFDVVANNSETFRMIVQINWSNDGEHSGHAIADSPRGTIPLHRGTDLNKFLKDAVSDIASWLFKRSTASIKAKKEIIATLLKAGRIDLANAVAQVTAESFPSHIPAEVEKKTREIYLTLHTLKFAMDKMEEIPKFLDPVYKETMKILATVDVLFKNVGDLQQALRKSKREVGLASIISK